MWFWPGKNVLVTLHGGQTLLGVTRFTWRFGSIRLGNASSVDNVTDAATDLQGTLVIPSTAVLFVQEVGAQ